MYLFISHYFHHPRLPLASTRFRNILNPILPCIYLFFPFHFYFHDSVAFKTLRGDQYTSMSSATINLSPYLHHRSLPPSFVSVHLQFLLCFIIYYRPITSSVLALILVCMCVCVWVIHLPFHVPPHTHSRLPLRRRFQSYSLAIPCVQRLL